MNGEREKLAEASYRKRSAKHKGRPHFYAYQKRQREKEALDGAKETERVRVGRFKKFKGQVADYWSGRIKDYPGKPG